MNRKRERGFTLAELMVVIVIIGLLATLVVPNVVSRIFTTKVGITKAQVANLDAAIQDFMIQNNGSLPDTLDKLVEPDKNGMRFLKDAEVVPRDPWDNEFFFTPDSNGMTYEVGSYGSDGQPGGEGDAADITNRTLASSAGRRKN